MEKQSVLDLFVHFVFQRALDCSDDPDSELINLLKSYHLPVELSKTLPLPDLMEKMKSDKKVHRGKLRFVLMNEIGNAFVKELEDLQEVEKVWRSVGAK